jgi:alkanesulfonate monooxygenase SsuD/methylene tetrahydromethanopterin reductase-like flavin-dependent oxidoreductase (luciferase family)
LDTKKYLVTRALPDFLDTFALIGTLIGQTSRIRFMTNVANLPLRPPQMLAKTSASLDLLSGGRFELGLGAGRAWPQIAGLGGPARTPAEAVSAAAEAIDVLRALWQPGRTTALPGIHRAIQLVGTVTDMPYTPGRPRTGPGGQPIRTTPDIWVKIIAEFAAEQRFDTINLMPEQETAEQLRLFATEVIPPARATATA